MSLDAALRSSVSSLRVNQEALSLIAGNIANANSENYTRRVITQSNQVTAGQVSGVQVDQVQRAVDDFLVRTAREQISGVGKTQAIREIYDQIEIYYGQPGAGNDISTAMDNFFAALADLSTDPEQTFLRSAALESGIAVADKISSLANALEETRYEVDAQISETVDEINTLIGQMSTLNDALREANRLGTDVSSLLDERDGTLSRLSELIDVSVNFNDIGQATIFMPSGELLAPAQEFRLTYSPAASADVFISGGYVDAIEVVQLLDDGTVNANGASVTLVSNSNAATPVNRVESGRLRGLLDMRDVDLPVMLSQLDELAQTLADSFNAIHNDGVGFPPPGTLTGSQLMSPSTDYFMSGQFRMAVLNEDGTPALGENALPMPPLTLDLSRLNSGNGDGVVDTQLLVDEINHYFGPPPGQIASIGDLYDIRMGAVSSAISSTKASGNIVFAGAQPAVGDTITINGTAFTFKDDAAASAGTTIEIQDSLAGTVSEIARYLNTYQNGNVENATYSAVAGTLTITHDTSGTAANGVFAIAADVTLGGGTVNVNGGGAMAADSDFLQNGVDATGTAEFDLEFSNLAGSNLTVDILSVSVDGGLGAQAVSFDPYALAPGIRQRTALDATSNDSFTIDFTGSAQGEGGTHTVSVQIQVTDGDGNISTETVDFVVTIPDPSTDIKNDRYAATAISGVGDGMLTTPALPTRLATARLVNADGKPVQAGEEGYVQIVANRAGTGIAIDSMDSSENGLYTDSSTATSRGLSHFWGLNDFFETGGALKNSAFNLQVRNGYNTNSALLATGELSLSTQPADPDANPNYTYELGLGSNQLIERLSELKYNNVNFDAVTGIPARSATLVGYASEVIGYNALLSQRAQQNEGQELILFEAFNDRVESSSAVNIDEELALTVNLQNNYAASARLVSIVSELFDRLIETF